MTNIKHLTLEVPDTTAAKAFYNDAFGLDGQIEFRQASDEPSDGFRGFTISLIVSQPSTVDSLFGTAIEAGATEIQPPTKSMWGYGAVVQAPDGAIWKIATQTKKDKGPATREIDDIVLLIAVDDTKASKQFYAGKGLKVGKSFGKYVEFDTAPVKLGLYSRKALAKDAGVAPEGSGSHGIVINGDAGAFTDLDGFAWE